MDVPGKKIPKTNGQWLLGDTLYIYRDMMGWLDKNRDEVGHIFHASIRAIDLIALVDPEHVQHVLQVNQKNYRKSFGYEILKLFLGEGLLTSEGDFWLRQRRLAQPAFHRRRLDALSRVMSEESAGLAAQWRNRPAGAPATGMLSEMMAVTMRIAARTLFSANVSGDIGTIHHNLELLNHFATQRIQSPLRMPTWMPTPRQRAFKKASSAINEVIYRIIAERKGHTHEYDDLLSMLMEARDEDTGEGMSDLQLRDEAMTIFVAGHETTAVSMTWTLYLLSQHPEAMARLRQEAETVLGDRPAAEASDMGALRFTRQVIDEALRLYPPAWIVGRRTIEADQISGYQVPQGANVLIYTYGIHRHPDLWERPDEFWPERWDQEAVKSLPKYSYFPFGGGPRLCIGNNFALMEMTILLATLAREFDFEFAETAPPGLEPLITLRPKTDMAMRIIPLPTTHGALV